MSLAAVANLLGQTTMPTVLAAITSDTLTVQAETVSTGTGGGQVKSGTTNAYTAVPCCYEPLQGSRFNSADKLVSTELYKITMPTHQSGTRINLDPKTHRLIVDARGNEPAKTFRIVAIADVSGVVFEVTCEREN